MVANYFIFDLVRVRNCQNFYTTNTNKIPTIRASLACVSCTFDMGTTTFSPKREAEIHSVVASPSTTLLLFPGDLATWMSLCFLDCILDNHGWRLYDTVPFTVTGCSWKFKYGCVHVKPTVNRFSDVMTFCAISELVFVKSKFCVGSNKPWSCLSLLPCLLVTVKRRLIYHWVFHTAHTRLGVCLWNSLCVLT